MQLPDHNYFMKEALKEAQKAYDKNEIPIGCVIAHRTKIIARAHNSTQTLNDVTAHAEMQAFTAASNYLGAKYLKDCKAYITLEPCIMCAGASYWTQIDLLVYGASDPKRGYSNLPGNILHPKTMVISGIMEEKCKDLLHRFFNQLRD